MKHQRVFQEPFMRDYFSLTEPQERRQAILDFMGKEDLLEAGSMYLIFGPQSSDPEGNIVLVAHYDTVLTYSGRRKLSWKVAGGLLLMGLVRTTGLACLP